VAQDSGTLTPGQVATPCIWYTLLSPSPMGQGNYRRAAPSKEY
jgi:hypothetical protein